MDNNLMKTTEDLTSFGQGNVEAILRSSQMWAAGLQDLSQSIAETAQAHLDHTLSAWKALSSAKSLKEAFDLQSGLARSSIEVAFTETSKLTAASMRLAEQSMAPIKARITVAVEKMTNHAV